MTRVLLVLALASGCSIALQAKPSKAPVAAACSTSSGYWIADSVGVAVGVAAFVTGIALAATADDYDASTGNIVAGLGGLTAVGYAASMGNGIERSRACRERQPVASR